MSWLPMFGIGALFGLLVAKDKKETELTQIHQALQEQVARQRDMNQMVQEEEDRKGWSE